MGLTNRIPKIRCMIHQKIKTHTVCYPPGESKTLLVTITSNLSSFFLFEIRCHVRRSTEAKTCITTDCLSTSSQKAMGRDVNVRDLKKRTVSRFLEVIGSSIFQEEESLRLENLSAASSWFSEVQRLALDDALDEFLDVVGELVVGRKETGVFEKLKAEFLTKASVETKEIEIKRVFSSFGIEVSMKCFSCPRVCLPRKKISKKESGRKKDKRSRNPASRS